ncbi:MAG: MFS transporter, partial [Flavobacteriaceae bacterium]
GILLAILMYFIVKEPIRGQIDGRVEDKKDPTFKEVIGELFSKKSFLFLCLGAGFTTFSSYSLNNFLPSFIQRAHGVDLITVSINLGLSIGIGGLIGALIGGRLADIKGAKNKKWYLYVPILSCVFSLSCLDCLIYRQLKNSFSCYFSLCNIQFCFYRTRVCSGSNLGKC